MTHTGPIWEFRELYFSRDADREETRQLLTFKAERGRWELDQTRIFRDGHKKSAASPEGIPGRQRPLNKAVRVTRSVESDPGF